MPVVPVVSLGMKNLPSLLDGVAWYVIGQVRVELGSFQPREGVDVSGLLRESGAVCNLAL